VITRQIPAGVTTLEQPTSRHDRHGITSTRRQLEDSFGETRDGRR
jgi:hypothetical protein